ncbi:MOSC domain-containing protein [Citricoccus sp. CH26A]|uniref:MOSC domain-containing protein n=1 Tax=Citricoccus TaxID=169133 RepID=UPI0002E8F3F5|nr:MOSC domain-containing protein [Citricoccus sp. CH26A]
MRDTPHQPVPSSESGPDVGRGPGAVVTVRVGRVQRQAWNGRELSTAAAKDVVGGPVSVSITGLAGDEQGDRKHHGGVEKAILAYAQENYDAWQADGIDIPGGGFFENLTVTGWPEAAVHAGDLFRIGEVLVQVSQPRRPCTTLSARWAMRELPQLVQQTGRSGYYLRVLEPGQIRAGDPMTLVSRLDGSVSVAEINRIMNVDRDDREGVARLLASPELPQKWRSGLQRRLGGEFEDDSARLGPS